MTTPEAGTHAARGLQSVAGRGTTGADIATTASSTAASSVVRPPCKNCGTRHPIPVIARPAPALREPDVLAKAIGALRDLKEKKLAAGEASDVVEAWLSNAIAAEEAPLPLAAAPLKSCGQCGMRLIPTWVYEEVPPPGAPLPASNSST